MGKIIALCISNKKGIQKHEIPEALFIENFGLEGDAHAGNWHRQVSFLDEEEINAFRQSSSGHTTNLPSLRKYIPVPFSSDTLSPYTPSHPLSGLHRCNHTMLLDHSDLQALWPHRSTFHIGTYQTDPLPQDAGQQLTWFRSGYLSTEEVHQSLPYE